MENKVYYMRTNSSNLSYEVRALVNRAMNEEIEIKKDAFGKPYLPKYDFHISLTHTKGLVAFAISLLPVGIDVERPRLVNLSLAERFFSNSERIYATDEARFLWVWTRKEALFKRDGKIKGIPFSQYETAEHPHITTCEIGEFTFSFCCENPQYKLVEFFQ